MIKTMMECHRGRCFITYFQQLKALRLSGAQPMSSFVSFTGIKSKVMNYRRVLGGLIVVVVVGGSAVGQSTSYTTSRSKTVINHNGVGSSFNVEMRGKIEITDDDKDIKSMSSDGYLEINKTVFGSRRTLIITPEGNGLKREYYEGRTQLPFEPEGRKWLAEVLLELVRTTTLGAESRVSRFYKQGGSAAVVSEITKMESDYVKYHYANYLMDLPVKENEYPTIISRIASSIDSDHYLSNFLRGNLPKFIKNRAATEAVFEASAKMDSDHYKTEVIKSALKSEPASLASVKVILNAASQMDSDHYKTEVLSTLLKQELSDEIVAEMIIASQSVGSDFYRSTILKKALAKPGLSSISFQRTLESVKDIDSDHYKTDVLKDLINNRLSSDLQITLVTLSGSIDSDFYVSTVMKSMLEKQELSDEAFAKLVDNASSISSDHYASEVLKSALGKKMSSANLIQILKVTGNISSDHYITTVLVEAAPMVRGADASVKDAYRSAAKRINSETYYGRAMRAIE
jgi:hypothetical protein